MESYISLSFGFLLYEKEIITLKSTGFEEIDKDYPNEDKQDIYSDLAMARGSPPSLALSKDSKAGGVAQKPSSGKKRGVSDCV